MARFRTWAPGATTVDVEVRGRRLPLERLEHGWWGLEVPDSVPGDDYAFVIDGGEALPDPRSPWQPAGVAGPSRLVGHDAFEWTDHGWQPPPLASGVVYELHIGTFTAPGTFESAIERLDHLVDLGITHVELMPVNQFPGTRGWGYDGVDLFAPQHAYGGPEGLKRLVNACHARGLAVLLDVVYNHIGPSGNVLARYGPYFTDRYRTPWGEAVNFDDRGSDEVRRFVCDNALSWLRDYHFDGLRIDAVHAIIDTSATHLLEELVEEVSTLERQLGRHLVLIAESDLNDPRLVRSREVGGYGLHAQWSDDFHHALHALLTGERSGYYQDFGTIADLAKALRQAFVYDGCPSVFRGRRHGRRATGLSGDRFVVFLQNHDQVGNRAQGERSSALMSGDRLRIGAAVVLLSPFVPMLFQGEEWGALTRFLYFTDHDDPELGRAVTEGRRSEFAAFGWSPEEVPDPQSSETFEQSKLDWNEPRQPEHAALLDWHRRLIALRRQWPELRDGRLDRMDVRFDESDRWLAFRRGRISVVVSLASIAQFVPLPDDEPFEVILRSIEGSGRARRGAVWMEPDSVAVLRHSGA